MKDYFDNCKDIDSNLELNMLVDELHLILIQAVRLYGNTVYLYVSGKHKVSIKLKDGNSKEEYNKLEDLFREVKPKGVDLGFIRESDLLSVIML
jgi:transcriptional regulator of NAD metabolism